MVVIWCAVVWFGTMWLVARCHVMWCYVIWCAVLWCDVMQWDGMTWDVLWCDGMWFVWCVELGDDVLWTTESPCHSKTRETSIPMCSATLRCKTQADYGEPMSQNYDLVPQRTTTYYNVLLQYYSVLQSTTPVILRTTKYYSSTTPYYKVLQST